MNLLRAKVKNERGWWEAKLLDLNVVADGDSEASMLRALEYTLTAEYHLALKFEQTPFVKLLTNPSSAVHQSWTEGDKKLRGLNLPEDVRLALSAVFRSPNISQFRLKPEPVAA